MALDFLNGTTDGPVVLKFTGRHSPSIHRQVQWMLRENYRLGVEDLTGKKITHNDVKDVEYDLSKDDQVVVGYYSEGKLVGVIHLYLPGESIAHEAHIAGLYVREEHRRKGIGRRLLEYIKESYIGDGDLVTIFVQGNNTPAFELYKSVGFKVNGYSLGMRK